jgi:hypothetical protein
VLLSGHEGRDEISSQGFESSRDRAGIIFRIRVDPVWEMEGNVSPLSLPPILTKQKIS